MTEVHFKKDIDIIIADEAFDWAYRQFKKRSKKK
jgi:hypothetical protein